MKFIQVFTKIPKHRQFTYEPRFYDAQEEDRKAREAQIRKELENQGSLDNAAKAEDETYVYRSRIAGSFRSAKKIGTTNTGSSPGLLRLVIALLLTITLIAYLQWGNTAVYILSALFIPLYLFWKFKTLRSGQDSSREP